MAASRTGRPVLAEGAEYPSGRRWWMVAVLVALTVLSFIDRNSLNVLIDDIKRDFGANDTHAGLLLGASFAIFYGLAGLPAGYLIDRYSRRLLIVCGVILWSSMTALSGLAAGFGMLFVGRMGVGLGEAILSPAAYSLIRNVFPLQHRARAIAVITGATAAGGGIALFVVGALVGAVPEGGLTLPVLGPLKVWQVVLVSIGALGLPMAALALTFSEPSRPPHIDGDEKPTVAFYCKWLFNQRRFYGPMFLAQALIGIGTYGFGGWMPISIVRKFGVAASEVGLKYGALQTIGAISGLVVGATVLDRLLKRRSAYISLVVGGVAAAIVGISCLLAPLMPTAGLTFAMILLHWMAVPTSGVGALTAITAATPGATIGKVAATSNLCVSLAGYGLGPSLVALASKLWFGGAAGIGHGVALVSTTALVFSTILYFVASRALAKSPLTPDAA